MQEFQSQAPLYSNTAQVVRRTEGIELTPCGQYGAEGRAFGRWGNKRA
jgi:hypothetical protein